MFRGVRDRRRLLVAASLLLASCSKDSVSDSTTDAAGMATDVVDEQTPIGSDLSTGSAATEGESSTPSVDRLAELEGQPPIAELRDTNPPAMTCEPQTTGSGGLVDPETLRTTHDSRVDVLEDFLAAAGEPLGLPSDGYVAYNVSPVRTDFGLEDQEGAPTLLLRVELVDVPEDGVYTWMLTERRWCAAIFPA